MEERQIISEPGELVALDIVGPFPVAKGGYQYILTYICLSSRWIDAVPLKSQAAKVVTEGAYQMFCRWGIP